VHSAVAEAVIRKPIAATDAFFLPLSMSYSISRFCYE
jgi:hypothetical protein